MPLMAGRSLQATDTSQAPRVAVINAAMARQVFEETPRRTTFRSSSTVPERNKPILVVGVVRDAKYSTAQRACSGDVLHAVHAGTARTDDVRSPNRRRCARLDRRRSRRDPQDRSRAAADARAHAGRTDRPDHPRPTSVRRIERGVWSDRPSAGLHRALRRGLLRCEATHERDRRAHGARRAAVGRRATRDGSDAVGRDDRRRRWDWCSRPSGPGCSASNCSASSRSTSRRWRRRPRSSSPSPVSPRSYRLAGRRGSIRRRRSGTNSQVKGTALKAGLAL